MTREEAIQQLDGAELILLNREFVPFNQSIIMAISALRAQQDQSPESGKMIPLTLDELRQMDGEPVWIVEYPDWGHWELSEYGEDYVLERDTDFYGMKYDDPYGRYGLHMFGWLAYRQKPEEDDHAEP